MSDNSVATPVIAKPAGVSRILLDTDIAKDVDDVGALATLHALADLGEAEILAILVSCANPHSAPCASAINEWYGRGDIPLGVVKGKAVLDPSQYAEQVATELPGPLKSQDHAEDAVRVARRVLAAEDDGAVTLVTIGFMTNLARLLDSGPDDISPLDGRTLVTRKICHWICMGGGFPEGHEFNFRQDPGAAFQTINQWPTPITFFGVELGFELLTGAALAQTPANSPVRRAYEHFYDGTAQDRYSWDQATVLYAVRGLKGQLDGYWRESEPGRILLQPDGTNTWQSDPAGRHRYLKPGRMEPAEISEVIEQLMVKAPVMQEIMP